MTTPIPPYTSPSTTDGDHIAAYMTEHVGGDWRGSGIGAWGRALGHDVAVYTFGGRLYLAGVAVEVAVEVGNTPAEAAALLRDPAALREHVSNALHAALAVLS